VVGRIGGVCTTVQCLHGSLGAMVFTRIGLIGLWEKTLPLLKRKSESEINCKEIDEIRPIVNSKQPNLVASILILSES
jgi:hypothetical protein